MLPITISMPSSKVQSIVPPDRALARHIIRVMAVAGMAHNDVAMLAGRRLLLIIAEFYEIYHQFGSF